ncbi:tRNA (cytidine(34)-2'-O)-methyltransferase [Kordiimonas sp. SCSIO 12610]|nr:tRNA (cytidine(34)-2'-O)-methyltransferase [Kordiimonas sp. SCSIO 12610]
MDVALYQPDQPQNAGTILRTGACLNIPVHIIEPCGFPFSVKAFRRSAMDYADLATIHHHADYSSFEASSKRGNRRIILLTTKADCDYLDFKFQADDILLVGSESSGVPDHVHAGADARITIPMRPEARSLNVAMSLAMVVGEAIRQTNNNSN